MAKCLSCAGTGECPKCQAIIFFSDDCETCGGSGQCPVCGGSGETHAPGE